MDILYLTLQHQLYSIFSVGSCVTYLHKEKQTAVAVLWSASVLITMLVIPAHQQTTYLNSTAALTINSRSC